MVYDLVLTIILEYLFVPERSERNGYKNEKTSTGNHGGWYGHPIRRIKAD